MMAAAMLAMTIAAAATKAAGSIVQGEHQASQLNQQADYDTQSGNIAAQQGFSREDAARRSSAQRLGALYASTAQSGIDPNSGSAAHVLADSATNAEYDALNVRYQGLAQRDQLMTRAAFERSGAKQARAGGYFGAAASLISSAASSVRPTTFGSGSSTFGSGGDGVGYGP